MKKHWVVLALALVFCAACVSSSSNSSDNGPKLELDLRQAGTMGDTFYFRGPVNVMYQLHITNPTASTYTLRRLDLRSEGPGAYSIRTGDAPIVQTIPPNGTTTVTLSAWANARGGRMTSTEPVTIRGIAHFDGPGGPFTKIFTETLSQF